jgi:creatinine amidohydrolase
VATLQLAAALRGPPAPPLDGLDLLRATAPTLDAAALAAPLALVTSGTYGELVQNLQYKLMEGMLLPMPPVWDVLHLAHGPFQQRVAGPATFLMLTRPDAPGEDAALDRFATMLDPDRHTLVRLVAEHAAPLALFEHEAMLNALMLQVTPRAALTRWRGPAAAPTHRSPSPSVLPSTGLRLAWTARAAAAAIVPLGATEQHGPHLPFATDTLIAERRAARRPVR